MHISRGDKSALFCNSLNIQWFFAMKICVVALLFDGQNMTKYDKMREVDLGHVFYIYIQECCSLLEPFPNPIFYKQYSKQYIRDLASNPTHPGSHLCFRIQWPSTLMIKVGIGIWKGILSKALGSGCHTWDVPGAKKKCWDESSMVIGSVGYIFITPIYGIPFRSG